MSKFDELWEQLKKEIGEYVESSWADLKDDALADSEEFLNKTKEDLKRWTNLLQKGELSLDDFKWLLEGKKDLAVLEALKRVGITQLSANRFINGLLDIIVSVVTDIFT